MNKKIKKFTMSQMLKRTSSGGGAMKALVRMSVRTKGDSPTTISFSLHNRIIEQLGWSETDVIDMNYDDGAIVLYRAPYGRVITMKNEHTKRSYVRYSIPQDIKLFNNGVAETCLDVETDNGMLAFKAPSKFILTDEVDKAE